MRKHRILITILIFCAICVFILTPAFASGDTAKLKQKDKEIDNLTDLVDKLNAERISLKKENDGLQKDISELKSNLDNEKSGLLMELGDTYTEAKLYSKAIRAYLRALELNPRNAEAHYNLALLYQQSEGDAEKAIYHLQLYLKMAPDIKHRKDAEYLLAVVRQRRISEYE